MHMKLDHFKIKQLTDTRFVFVNNTISRIDILNLKIKYRIDVYLSFSTQINNDSIF